MASTWCALMLTKVVVDEEVNLYGVLPAIKYTSKHHAGDMQISSEDLHRRYLVESSPRNSISGRAR
jgi:hypothetical protein